MSYHLSSIESAETAPRKPDPAERAFDLLCEKVRGYAEEGEIARLREAFALAKAAHAGQKRSSGEDYILHPIAVTEILADLHLDGTTLTAALLHDVVEDTPVTLEEIGKRFGPEVVALVDGVTKLRRIQYATREEQQAENLRKMLLAMAKDIRVILIKLADRLHNMRTLRHVPEQKQMRIAKETLEIFAPLAHRLGISRIQWELEDLALRYLNPQQYYRIANLMTKKRREREAYIQKVIDTLKEKFVELNIKADISGRPKHIYSVYRKMVNQNKQFGEIYDLLAVRVIVDNIKDCYAILGVVHTLWRPLPGRFKDYIAMPKPNMYQSLHTTVVGPQGEPLEIQIRTWEMHRTAEYGIAAHWLYKQGGRTSDPSFQQKLAWFREILEWQQDFRDAQDFMETLKVDLFSDEVFVFTPKGDVVALPTGSVPIDFAYRIHTDIGNRCVGARVNGRIVPLDYRLKTGDIVEILTSKHSYGPSRDWLKIVKSSQAKSRIRQWFKKEHREENVGKGKELLERELKKHGIEWADVPEAVWQETGEKLHYSKAEDLWAAVGYGAVGAQQAVGRVLERLRKDERSTPALIPGDGRERKGDKSSSGIRVKGVDNLLVRFARCCNPVPGDEIVGYVTRGRGVSVHRANCPNLKQLSQSEGRMIDVSWESSPEISYNVEIEVTGLDRCGLINDVMNAVAETKTDITAVNGRADQHKMAIIHLSLNIRNVDHLHTVIERIKRIRDIYTVRRVVQ
ncbi:MULTISPECIES: RelA/SpoT family protein [Kyrpidia]|uniref:GTP pyrophosphokinase (RelA/SpoT) n=2 Tax=Kyrpidia spormannii TaxID=2055160 RepID=A0ACA8ZB85_9BACL|nr:MULTISPECIES: bifunctional (p)ppGpp synthetase/guanosine-3',5'-bis(diphosphate) 3'-pyrophosphohydrolase [Kyrpidia]CAB3393467.1 GTP pyrophosphokinase (RelA/SpoT) [Kyrpidia spormannii]CAB3394388.1 GTP pyrophosphokinase (RelA/SpoT) [Kyrpidia spormannii]